MNQAEHFIVIRVGIRTNAVILQGLGCAATTLVECSDESGFVSDFFELLVGIGHGNLFFRS